MLSVDVNQTPSFFYVIAVAPILTLGRLFPFTLNGLGSDEALIVFLFKANEIAGPLALSAAIIYKLFLIILPGLIGFLVIIISKGHKPNKELA